MQGSLLPCFRMGIGYMFTTYEEALEWIHSRKGMGVKPGIKRMEWLMEKMGHPERQFCSIHVAGTNGKGSTVAYLTSLFREAGYTTGSFTSPHIMRFNERISHNGSPISDEAVLQLTNAIFPLYEELCRTEMGAPTQFEVITAMMFLYFSQVQPDVVLVEVGLGGLYDSTNVVAPDFTLVTTIGMDHMNILGDTIEEIAFQKAGIIKEGVPLVIGNIEGSARTVLLEEAHKKAAPAAAYGRDFLPQQQEGHPEFGERFNFRSKEWRFTDLDIFLMGPHQVDNAATALYAFLRFCQEQGWQWSEEGVRQGLRKAFWPVRMEVISHDPLIILDGAHNEPAMKALLASVQEHFSNRKVHVLVAALADKNLEKMGAWLAKIPGAEFHLTTFAFPRAASVRELEQRMQLPQARLHDDWQQALEELQVKLSPTDVLLVTGSLYFLSDVRHYFLDER